MSEGSNTNTNTDLTFITADGETVKRELLIAYLNTGTASSAVWSPVGCRVEDSSMEYDWGDESSTDILGNTRTTMKKPVITQSFDPYKLDNGDPAIVKIWNLAVREQNYAALCNMDMLIVHAYTSGDASFAEHYDACAIKPTSLGGEGGGDNALPFDVTYGGKRETGTAAVGTGGTLVFTADT